MFFYGCANLSALPTIKFSPSENFKTVSFLNAFHNCKKIKTLDKIIFEPNSNYKLTITDLESMCSNCSELTTFPSFLINENVLFSNSIKAQNCFVNCSSLTGTIPSAFINKLIRTMCFCF